MRGVPAPLAAVSGAQRLLSGNRHHQVSASPAWINIAAARAAVHCPAAATNGSAPVATNGASDDKRPSAAETARTIVDLAAHGTLCTVSEGGIPLGTYASYVLDSEGQPILRLRADAVHTANLMRNPKCSLFVQPSEYPTRLLARLTLIGSVEPVSDEVAASAAALHNTLHAGGVGVDAPQVRSLSGAASVSPSHLAGLIG